MCFTPASAVKVISKVVNARGKHEVLFLTNVSPVFYVSRGFIMHPVFIRLVAGGEFFQFISFKYKFL